MHKMGDAVLVSTAHQSDCEQISSSDREKPPLWADSYGEMAFWQTQALSLIVFLPYFI